MQIGSDKSYIECVVSWLVSDRSHLGSRGSYLRSPATEMHFGEVNEALREGNLVWIGSGK